MNGYVLRWKRFLFWQKKKVCGHAYDKDTDKMVLYLMDGSIREIKKFHNCELALGIDWVLVTKQDMEKASGQSIPVRPE